MPNDAQRMSALVRDVGNNTSEKIRRLVKAGYRQADVARFLKIRDQYVSNVVRKEKSKGNQWHRGGELDKTPSAAPHARYRLTVDSAGRIVIPVEFRRAMNAKEGSELLARVVDGELRLITPDMAVERAQKLVRELIPGDESLAESLIADRRREAAQEAADG
ncbi:MAG TPA: AbrB/MazE/SpoVT family DNA-binding domain-containing protein [Aestuariivirgaceae bacterium]|nr:AbrB/MazE/SpoVT family DNA-binding domain-containing protein [Aestuariivirgaceae bacterium]